MKLASKTQVERAIRRAEEATGKEAVRVDFAPDGGIGVTFERPEPPAVPQASLVTMTEK